MSFDRQCEHTTVYCCMARFPPKITLCLMAYEFDAGSLFALDGFDANLLKLIFLAEHAYNSHKRDESGIFAACKYGRGLLSLGIATDLLLNEANETGPGRGSLIIAAQSGNVPMLKLLLDWQEDAYARGLVDPVPATEDEIHKEMAYRPRVIPKLKKGCTVKPIDFSLVSLFCERNKWLFDDKWTSEMDQCDKMLLEHVKAHAMDFPPPTMIAALPPLCSRGQDQLVEKLLGKFYLAKNKELFDKCCREAAMGDSCNIMAMLYTEGGIPCEWTGVVAAECNSPKVLAFLLDRGFILPQCVYSRVKRNTECEELVKRAQLKGQIRA